MARAAVYFTPRRITDDAAEAIRAIRPRATAKPSPPRGAATGATAVAAGPLGTLLAGRTAVVPTAGRAPGIPETPGLGATELEAGTREVSFFGGPGGIVGLGPLPLAAGIGAPPGPGRGGRLMRTVSFLGAFAGAPIGLIAPGGGANGAEPVSLGPAGGFTTAPGCGIELGGTAELLPGVGCVGGVFVVSAMRRP